jgi:REP element-mobilizing transposase RayT
MSRRLRFIPDHGALVEVTCRALQSRFLLRPGATLDSIILGALARAQRRYAVRIIAFFFASNHFHLILEVDDAWQLSLFMNYFSSKIAREIGRLTGWREKIFGRRYQAIQISDEPEAQIARLRYVLSHGVKEGLVERLQEWPGVHCVDALTEGKTLEGWWFDRTQEYLARRRGEDFGTYQYATRETLELAPLPCWKHLTPEKRQQMAAAMVSEIEAEAADRRERTGVPSRPRGPPRRPSTPPAEPSAASCATPTFCSSPRTGPPPRSSGRGNAMRPSPSAASRRPCRSWAGRRRADLRFDLKTACIPALGTREPWDTCVRTSPEA